LIGGELFVFGRHPQIIVGVTDRLDQKALFKVAGFDGGAGIASFQQTLARIQEQAALDLGALLAVARVAIVHQDGADLASRKTPCPRDHRRPWRLSSTPPGKARAEATEKRKAWKKYQKFAAGCLAGSIRAFTRSTPERRGHRHRSGGNRGRNSGR
jgi:hypothetical protein